MQDLPFDKQVRIALNEIIDRRRACSIWFAIVSLTIIAIGLQWPKTYESSTTLLRDQAEVVRPLLEGTAVTGSSAQHSEIAKEVIYSNRNLDTVIDKAGLRVDKTGVPLSDREVEILKAELRKRIKIERSGADILKISYTSSDPEEAYVVVSIASNLFIADTTQKKKSGSQEAYSFIQKQVDEYKQKLDEINRKINEFKAENLEIQVDSTGGINSRIAQLNEEIRRTALELKEAGILRESLIEQLGIESQKSSAEEVVNSQQARLEELESQLNTLRLTYTDTYPDIVQLKEQIRSLKKKLSEDSVKPGVTASEDKRSSGTVRTALYERLNRQIVDQETLIKTLEARKLDLDLRFNQELARSSKVNQLVSKLEELSRDREVTQLIYNQLLTRKENAQVSLNLEMENAGSLFKVQEPPTIPLVPKGLRFLHFAIASVVLGIGIPIGVIVGLLLIDPRIRHEDSADLEDDIPVIGIIPTFRSRRDVVRQRLITAQSIAIFVLSMAAITGLSLSRYYEII